MLREQHQKELRGYILGKVLGRGKYGKVRLVYKYINNTKVIYAMKVILKNQVENTSDLSRIRRETKIMTSLNHPHIIKCIEVFETENEICIVMEYADGGDLYNYIASTSDGYLTLNEACYIFRQIVCAIRYCHTHQIVHRDLKPENIFLDKHRKVKIGDFGFSRVFHLESGLSTPCGSLAYVAPEVISGKEYIGPTADIWSLGCIFYVMLVGRLPFDALTNPEIVDRIRRGDFHDHHNLTDRTKKFLRRVLYPNTAKRYQIAQIATHAAIWEDKSVLHKALLPFATKLAYSKPYHQQPLVLTLQRSFSETQLRTILDDFKDKNNLTFLTDSIPQVEPEPEVLIPPSDFKFPRLVELKNVDEYNAYYNTVLKNTTNTMNIAVDNTDSSNSSSNEGSQNVSMDDGSSMHISDNTSANNSHEETSNNNSTNSSNNEINMTLDEETIASQIRKDGVFIPRVATKVNSSGSPATLRLVELRRSQANSPLAKSNSGHSTPPTRPKTESSLRRSTSHGNVAQQ